MNSDPSVPPLATPDKVSHHANGLIDALPETVSAKPVLSEPDHAARSKSTRTAMIMGQLLIVTGVIVGAAASVSILFIPDSVGLDWLVGIGMVKLALIGSLGLIGAGAYIRRLTRRSSSLDVS